MWMTNHPRTQILAAARPWSVKNWWAWEAYSPAQEERLTMQNHNKMGVHARWPKTWPIQSSCGLTGGFFEEAVQKWGGTPPADIGSRPKDPRKWEMTMVAKEGHHEGSATEEVEDPEAGQSLQVNDHAPEPNWSGKGPPPPLSLMFGEIALFS